MIYQQMMNSLNISETLIRCLISQVKLKRIYSNEALRIDTEELDIDITETEVKTCIQKLKTNKAWGTDGILNEYLNSTVNLVSYIYLTI